MNMEQRIRAVAIIAVASSGQHWGQWDREPSFWKQIEIAERYVLNGTKPDIPVPVSEELSPYS